MCADVLKIMRQLLLGKGKMNNMFSLSSLYRNLRGTCTVLFPVTHQYNKNWQQNSSQFTHKQDINNIK